MVGHFTVLSWGDSIILLRLFSGAQMEVHFKHLSLSLEILASVPRIKDGYNPATWMLEAIGAGVADAGDKQPTEDVNFVQCKCQQEIA
ncbi:unnamed protein product [Phytophthora lilii]|uniref:Unnamed protein product n=1 Tax=Phytophthora lilii TaxID=2077276 RepID=A0A9W6TIW4_9STRA|nr:unnamed protein product [Phytophthora lilii]